MQSFLELALVVLAAVYIGGPLLVLFTHKQNARPELRPMAETAMSEVPYFAAHVPAIQTLGFELVGCYQVLGVAPNVEGRVAYLVHRANGDGAVVCVFTSPVQTIRMMEFGTKFTDGGSLTVGNTLEGGAYVRPKHKPIFRYPQIQDGRRLYAIYRGAARLLRPGAAKDVPARGQEVERLIESVQAEMADQVPEGILRLDEAKGVYRATLYGAFRMTWSQLPPFKQIGRARLRARSRALLRQVESDPAFAAGA